MTAQGQRQSRGKNVVMLTLMLLIVIMILITSSRWRDLRNKAHTPGGRTSQDVQDDNDSDKDDGQHKDSWHGLLSKNVKIMNFKIRCFSPVSFSLYSGHFFFPRCCPTIG